MIEATRARNEAAPENFSVSSRSFSRVFGPVGQHKTNRSWAAWVTRGPIVPELATVQFYTSLQPRPRGINDRFTLRLPPHHTQAKGIGIAFLAPSASLHISLLYTPFSSPHRAGSLYKYHRVSRTETPFYTTTPSAS